jgi:hypothetical protein
MDEEEQKQIYPDSHTLGQGKPEWQFGQVGTRGSEVVETINEAVLDNTWRRLPQDIRDAIKLGAQIGWDSGSTMPDGSPNPIQVQDLELLLNLSPQVLKYKAVRAGISRGLGFDPRLVDQAAIATGGAQLLKKGINKVSPQLGLTPNVLKTKPTSNVIDMSNKLDDWLSNPKYSKFKQIPAETSISIVKPGSLFSKDYKGILSKPQPYAYAATGGDGEIRPVESDLPLSAAGDESAPSASWGVTSIVGQEAVDLAKIVYEGSIEPEQLLDGISQYKGGGIGKDFSKWAREVYTPLMKAAAKEQNMGLQPFFSLVASKPGFKYIEHRIAKREDLKWYWEMQGDPNKPWYVKANNISNLRLLLNDRFKKLKDAVEVQIYGGSKGTGGINENIPNRANRYIVDIEAPSTGRQYSSMDQNPGDIVIRKAGSNQEVGRIGEYYDVLWSSFDDLMKNPGFVAYFDGRYDVRYRGEHRPDWRGMTQAQLKDAVRDWRNLIISDHLDIIRRKENSLVGLTEQEKLEKINIALIDDMTEFRDEFSNVLPFLTRGQWSQIHKDMTYEDILKLQQNTEYTPKAPTEETIDEVLSRPRFPTKTEEMKQEGRPKSVPKSG